ncbi:MAG: hypothetical protein AB1432_07160 [Bacteroidota bacterium]
MSFKKSFTKYLFGITIFLLVVNIVIEFVARPGKSGKSGDAYARELTTRQIDSIFVEVLNQYGIESRWISTKPDKIKDEDSLKKQFTVYLPADLPIPLIIRDVNKVIENDITGFVSEEKKNFGTTEIRIYTNELLKLKATLISDPQTIRERNNLTFIITDAINLRQSDFFKFLSLPYSLCLTVIPSEAGSLQVDSLEKYSKEYIVLLNNEMTEKKYKLESRDQKTLIRNSISNILKDFKEAKLLTVDESSRLFNSVIYNFVRDEFLKKNKELVPLSRFILLDANNDNELISKFKFHCMDGSSGTQKTFLITYQNFLVIRNELELFRKKGHKILPISEIQK